MLFQLVGALTIPIFYLMDKELWDKNIGIIRTCPLSKELIEEKLSVLPIQKDKKHLVLYKISYF